MSEMLQYDDFDFIGFTFNGHHSSEFGLLRTSDGDRYEDNLVPSLKDEAADVPGGVGQYYWGEKIESRSFNIPIAYDNMTETTKRKIKKWLHPDDKLHELIFDEKPYVKYWVKCSKEVDAKELCFNELIDNQIQRVYKGEFEIQFTAYMPYGVVVNKSLNDYTNSNKDEWAEASGLLTASEYSKVDKFTDLAAKVYNPGDKETGFVLRFNKLGSKTKLTYNAATTNQGYEMVTKTLDELPENKYFIFIDDKKYKLSNTIEATNITEVSASSAATPLTDSGYIDNTSGAAKFVSNSSGKAYDIYTTIEEVQGYNYTLNSGLADFGVGYMLYGISDENTVYKFVVLSKDNNNFTLNFLAEKEVTPPTNLYIAPSTNMELNIGLYDASSTIYPMEDYNVTLASTAAATTHPNYWTEAQKLLFIDCEVKIDTNKQTIVYRKDEYSDWVGVAGIIKKGSLFKIPVDGLDGNNFKSIKFTQSIGNPFYFKNNTNPTIEYTYLYI